MNVFEFMSGSPWVAFFIAMIIAGVIKAPFLVIKRWIRRLDIKAQGWPPVHCDADGDFQSEGD